MQQVSRRLRFVLPDLPALNAVNVLHFAFNFIQCAELLERLVGDLAAVVAPQLVEFASRMSLMWSST
jgi:hypothetical protein